MTYVIFFTWKCILYFHFFLCVCSLTKGHNNHDEWAIEARRLIPLLPRAIPDVGGDLILLEKCICQPTYYHFLNIRILSFLNTRKSSFF